jgi:pimeloyl-ACP methyl ester carboxylesterase/DNA-binding winged helix-turn-helix (wHTH) protein
MIRERQKCQAPFRLGEHWITPQANDVDGVRVEAKSMDVLVALADSYPAVLSAAEILERVWPSVVVVDNVVYQAIAQLRKALHDDPHAPCFIENIPKRGYRLIAPIERDLPLSHATESLEAGSDAATTDAISIAAIGAMEAGSTAAHMNDASHTQGPANRVDDEPANGAIVARSPSSLNARAAALVVFMLVAITAGFANRTELNVWARLHVSPLISRPIDQHIAFATTSDGVRIAYGTSGNGPPLVLSIGWFTHLKDGQQSPNYDSAGQLRGYSRDHLVVRYDGRGFGMSDRNVTDFSLDARVRDLEAVVDALGLEQFSLLGYSAGGPTVLAYTARHPERVSRLVLLATWMNADFMAALDAEMATQWTQHFARMPRMWEFVRTNWEEPAARAAVIEWSHPKASEVERRVMMELARTAGDGQAFYNFSMAGVGTDVAWAARQIHVPTLVVAGSEDTELPVLATSQLAAAIPGARFELIDGADHFEACGNDARVLQLVSAFLAEEPRAG